MLRWQASKYDIKSLMMVDVPIPEPGPRQILVKVSAVSLNYRDLLALQGEFGRNHEVPLVPTSDASGVIHKMGTEVRRFKRGDRVTSTFAPKWVHGKIRTAEQSATLGIPLPGVLQEYVVLDEEGAVHSPKSLTDVEACTLPIAAVTAWSALFERCNLQPGESVLVQGTGGVALFALQFARLAGATVIVTSSSDEKLHRAMELGATEGINYSEMPDWDVAVQRITGGSGVDHVLEVAGGERVNRSLYAAKIGGNVVIVGLLQASTFTLDILDFILRQATLHTLSVGSRDAFENMNRAIDTSQIKPVIDSQFDFDDAPIAFDRMKLGSFGKIVIRLSP
jgi:NADPH:quinone reductase-like Zn-dependent oxidoreductase